MGARSLKLLEFNLEEVTATTEINQQLEALGVEIP
jgi:hypothetical protein